LCTGCSHFSVLCTGCSHFCVLCTACSHFSVFVYRLYTLLCFVCSLFTLLCFVYSLFTLLCFVYSLFTLLCFVYRLFTLLCFVYSLFTLLYFCVQPVHTSLFCVQPPWYCTQFYRFSKARAMLSLRLLPLFFLFCCAREFMQCDLGPSRHAVLTLFLILCVTWGREFVLYSLTSFSCVCMCVRACSVTRGLDVMLYSSCL